MDVRVRVRITRGVSHLKIVLFAVIHWRPGDGLVDARFPGRRSYRAWLIFCTVLFRLRELRQGRTRILSGPYHGARDRGAGAGAGLGPADAAGAGVGRGGSVCVIGSIQLMTTGRDPPGRLSHSLPGDDAFVKQQPKPGELVMGSTELGWELGWRQQSDRRFPPRLLHRQAARYHGAGQEPLPGVDSEPEGYLGEGVRVHCRKCWSGSLSLLTATMRTWSTCGRTGFGSKEATL